MGSDVDGEVLGEQFKGYTLRITGGNDKQGFTMKQGILVNGRVKILMRQSKYKKIKSYYPTFNCTLNFCTLQLYLINY